MLYIIAFLLDVVIGLVGGACLLRLYMQHQRVPFGNPVGRFVFALTDWLVLPLRRMLPSVRRWDTASIAAAFLLELVQVSVLWLLTGQPGAAIAVPAVAVLGLVRLVISGLTGLMIVYAVLSWVRGDPLLTDIIDRLASPLLRPFRKLIPLVGGVDLSPLAFLVVLQVAAYLVRQLSFYFGPAARVLYVG